MIEPIRTKESHFKLLYNRAGVTPEVLNFRYPRHGTPKSLYLINFLPTDTRNPKTFSQTRKYSIYSGSIRDIISSFGAPLSEIFGRQSLFIFTFFILTILNTGAASSRNFETILVLQFLSSTFSSSLLTNAGSIITDIFSTSERSIATALFTAAPFLGPVIAIFSGLILAISLFIYPETYTPYLLHQHTTQLSYHNAIIYGTLYILFTTFPIIYYSLAFIGIAISISSTISYYIYNNKHYTVIVTGAGGAAQPEARLPPTIVGSILLPISLFYISIIASSFFGAGLVLVFLSLLNYIIDSYVIYTASALAANSASSIPAFLALTYIPFPYKYTAEATALLKQIPAVPEPEAIDTKTQKYKVIIGIALYISTTSSGFTLQYRLSAKFQPQSRHSGSQRNAKST
ncbi:polyamine transporter 1 [Plectosphaerella cucumerina]|uniref:Polyamine transporter 1 n=1 Tax=Plectosphaerella cucumerina TaxID=40658 RepID=A0A8K0TL53_9PEZI|nr:polyamine transporter 1 [Plectosphaerella cucumerina]